MHAVVVEQNDEVKAATRSGQLVQLVDEATHRPQANDEHCLEGPCLPDTKQYSLGVLVSAGRGVYVQQKGMG
jgi:hypothetical protein